MIARAVEELLPEIQSVLVVRTHLDGSVPVEAQLLLAILRIRLNGARLVRPAIYPANLSALLLLIQRGMENQRNQQKQMVEKVRHSRGTMNPFLGNSATILKLAELAARIAAADSPVLIQGETGTGKGVLARWMHDNGRRSAEPFLDLNCGGLSRDLLETELFGHERGAFTGAVQSKSGLLEIAHKGTVFLDEIGDVDLNVQPKLLKVLEQLGLDVQVHVKLLKHLEQSVSKVG